MALVQITFSEQASGKQTNVHSQALIEQIWI